MIFKILSDIFNTTNEIFKNEKNILIFSILANFKDKILGNNV